MIGEICKYIMLILTGITCILCIIEVIKLMIKGPVQKALKHKIMWTIVCILYIACALCSVCVIIFTLKG